jgi:hypothetical protein
MSVGSVGYRAWILRILTWDTALPACVAFIPAGVGTLFRNRRGVMEITAVTLPVAAFLLRLRAGRRHIASNRCPKWARRVQYGVFCLGILPLALIDCCLILSGLMPRGARFANAEDRAVWAVLVSIYLVSMIVAMYPGRVASPLFVAEGLSGVPEVQ